MIEKEQYKRKEFLYIKIFNMGFDSYTSSREIISETPKYKVYEVKNINDVGFGNSSKCYSDKDKLHFVVNGPLVNSDGEPVGGYVNNSVQKKEFFDPRSSKEEGNFFVDNGIFGLAEDGKLHLIPYGNRGIENHKWKWAFQNGPILVLHGVNKREGGTSTSKFNRSGIGFTPSGKAIVIYCEIPITLKEFAKLFIKEGCNNAIYLDGGPYSGYEDLTGPHGKLVPEAKKLQFFHQK